MEGLGFLCSKDLVCRCVPAEAALTILFFHSLFIGLKPKFFLLQVHFPHRKTNSNPERPLCIVSMHEWSKRTQQGAFCEFENVGKKCVRRDPAAFRSSSGICSGAVITARGTA